MLLFLKAESAETRLKKIEQAGRAARKNQVSPAEGEKELGNQSFAQKKYEEVSSLFDIH